MFRDIMEIKLKAGDGGDGCVSFRHEKYVPKGGADGGDGGRGGDVILAVDPRLEDLSHFINRRSISAGNGHPGEGVKRYGSDGKDAVVSVPRGTWVYNKGESEPFADLKNKDDSIVIFKGGKGGKGNFRFISSVNRTPRSCGKGARGGEGEIKLEYGLPVDIALFGPGNSGKTALIAALTGCKTRSDPHPFSHQRPNLSRWHIDEAEVLEVADLPSLGEEGEGGFTVEQMRRQLRRPILRLLVLDASRPREAALKSFEWMEKSLSRNPGADMEWSGVVLNKADSSSWTAPNRILEDWRGLPCITVSAAVESGTEVLVDWIKISWAKLNSR